MKKSFTYLIVVSLGIFIGFAICIFLARNPPFVDVVIQNESSQPVQLIRLESEKGYLFGRESLTRRYKTHKSLCFRGVQLQTQSYI